MKDPFIRHKKFGIQSFLFCTVHGFDRRTDGRPDILLMAKTAVHRCSTVKSVAFVLLYKSPKLCQCFIQY